MVYSIGRFFSRPSTSNPSATYIQPIRVMVTMTRSSHLGWHYQRADVNEGGVFVLTRSDQPWYVKLVDLACTRKLRRTSRPGPICTYIWAHFGGSRWQRFPSFLLSLNLLNGLFGLFGQAESPGTITSVFGLSNQADKKMNELYSPPLTSPPLSVI